jgi:hypothetical protein
MGRKSIVPGVSFSWKRAVGITSAKQKIARMTGIPTTRSGRRRKAGSLMGCALPVVITMIIFVFIFILIGCSEQSNTYVPEKNANLSEIFIQNQTATISPTETPIGYCNKQWAENSIKVMRDVLGTKQESNTEVPTSEEIQDSGTITDEQAQEIHNGLINQIKKINLLVVPPCLYEAKKYTLNALTSFDSIYAPQEGDNADTLDKLYSFGDFVDKAEYEMQSIEDCLPTGCYKK